jgi:prephenate dehydrogenase
LTPRKAGVIGLGLIGGSLAKALKTKCGFQFIAAMNRSPAPLAQALAEGVIDARETAPEALALEEEWRAKLGSLFADCEIIFICAPVDQIAGYLARLNGLVKEGCIITDVGSTKESLSLALQPYEKMTFIGGHPMAGSEKTGYSHARDDLFENAYYILTPPPWVKNEAMRFLVQIIERLGAVPLIMDPAAHDEAMAAISHGPHVIAAALVNLIRQLDGEPQTMRALAAGGFKDLTRVASSSPEIWSAICESNQTRLLKFLNAFKAEIESFEQILRTGGSELNVFFQSAKKYRDSFHV